MVRRRCGDLVGLSLTMAVTATVSACGSSSNINQIWGSDEGADTLLAEARSAYDEGDFSAAEQLASRLLGRSPDNERAAVLLGYTYLSQGGLDPYRVATCLIEISQSDESSTSTAKAVASTSTSRCSTKSTASGTVSLIDQEIDEFWYQLQKPASQSGGSGTSQTGGTQASSSSSDVSSLLKKLQSGLLSLSAEDFAKLQEKSFTGSSDLFATGNALLVPKDVSEDLRNSVHVLQKMNQAIKAICRFVDDAADMKADTARYQAAGCTLTTQRRRNAAKAHYLWGMSHLAESLVYQSVLLYDTTGGKSTSNIQAASDKLNQQTSANITSFVSQVNDLKDAIDAVFDTNDPNSMISATLNDLTAVNAAFGAIAGLPESMRSQLKKIMENIKTIGASVGGGTTGESKALKTQMTENFTKTVSKKTDDTVKKLAEAAGQDATNISAEVVKKLPETQQKDVATLCTAYGSLSKDMPADKQTQNKPKACT